MGVKIDLKVDGSELKLLTWNLTLAMENMEPKVIRPAIEEGMEYGRKYPPEIPGQRYQRTGTYFRAWRISQHGRRFTTSVKAVQKKRDYTIPVGGGPNGGGQAAIHTDRWVTIYTAVQYAASLVAQRARDLFNRAVTGSFYGL